MQYLRFSQLLVWQVPPPLHNGSHLQPVGAAAWGTRHCPGGVNVAENAGPDKEICRASRCLL